MIKPNYTSWTADEGPSAGYQMGMFIRNAAGVLFLIIQAVIFALLFIIFAAAPSIIDSWMDSNEQANTLPPTFASRCEATGVFID